MCARLNAYGEFIAHVYVFVRLNNKGRKFNDHYLQKIIFYVCSIFFF